MGRRAKLQNERGGRGVGQSLRGNCALLAPRRRFEYTGGKVVKAMETKSMETKDILLQLRTKAGLSQDELAERMFVTRQAVSRWERGDTIPNTETLKRLSKLFDVSINTLLGSPRELICQCCGMPLADDSISREADGFLNEDYCKWCYADGEFKYDSEQQLIDFCVEHMASESWPAEQVRAHMEAVVPQLRHWKEPCRTESEKGGL